MNEDQSKPYSDYQTLDAAMGLDLFDAPVEF